MAATLQNDVYVTGAELPTKPRPLWKEIRYELFRRFARGRTMYNRVVMEKEVRKLIDGLETGRMDCLEISGEQYRHFPWKSYNIAHYPGLDICEGTLPERFDFICAEQVWEHLLWPYRAGRNVHAMLRDDGYFLITTPFMVRVHPVPVDCSRWTELGLKYFLAECGFPLGGITTGSWGNFACVKANRRVWMPYIPWLHSLANDPEFPTTVWALAQKQDA